jgi:lysyl-tRNA synthetase class 2
VSTLIIGVTLNMTQSDLLKSIRQYFWDQNFVEVEIPYLNPSLPLEPNIYSFTTTWTHQNQKYFLPTSPELALKKYLAEKNVNCFSISHCFRDLEDSNSLHTPEFLMLEWYEVNQNLSGLQQSTQKFINKFLDIKFSELVLPSHLPDTEPDFNQYFLNEIEPQLPQNQAVFVTGYPAFLSPLAQNIKVAANESINFSAHSERVIPAQPEDSPKVTSTEKIRLTKYKSKRFELYINGIEIGNGCTENRDSASIKSAFENEKTNRQKNNLPLHPYSQDFIDISSLIPPCSGIGLGIDRLLSIINL